MATKKKPEGKSPEEAESEVYNVISAFEQILQAMPTDRVALETLHEAYEKIGDQAHALNYLVRLAQVVVEEGDAVAAPKLAEKLKKAGGADAQVTEALKGLQGLIALKATQPGEAEAAEAAATRRRRRAVDITAELALAWNLLQAEEISQDDYTSIVQDLTESTTKQIGTPISVLHVLSDRQFKNADKILTFMSKDSGLPIITLDRFDIRPEAYNMLPPEFSSQHGALVFDLLGGEPLVAILNPHETELRAEVARLAGAKCHFFLVTASDYDLALKKMKDATAAAAPAGAAPSAKK
ncbi:MAG: hypothetical protein JXB04_09980 [Kiritimatiellae bacterium]|nr:hypothetical protein [Kiritimatiellia bacterium]